MANQLEEVDAGQKNAMSEHTMHTHNIYFVSRETLGNMTKAVQTYVGWIQFRNFVINFCAYKPRKQLSK